MSTMREHVQHEPPQCGQRGKQAQVGDVSALHSRINDVRNPFGGGA